MDASSRTPVVVGVSGSPASQRAVEAAAKEACARGRPLLLVHAFNWLPAMDRPHPAAGEVLHRAVNAVARTAPALAISTELMEGAPLNGLLRRSRHAALTVIGDSGLNSRVCLPADALAVQVAARASGTVMITRADPPPKGPVVVGVDGSPAAGYALDLAFDLARHRDTGLIVIHARETSPQEEDRSGTRTTVVDDLIASRAHRCGTRVETRLIDGDPITVLRRESLKASIVVVGARGQLPYRGLIGSVTQTLLHHSPAPVVVVRGSVPGAHQREAPPVLIDETRAWDLVSWSAAVTTHRERGAGGRHLAPGMPRPRPLSWGWRRIAGSGR